MMKIAIENKRRNELLKRIEVKFSINHEGNGTPSRMEIRRQVAGMLDASEERVYINKFETKTGSMSAFGEANIYDSAEKAKYTEPEYIILRNTPKEENEAKEPKQEKKE